MNSLEDKIHKAIEHGLGKVPWVLLRSRNEFFQFECLFNKYDFPLLNENKQYSLYQITALERFLSKKNGILSPKLLTSFYSDKDPFTFCYIIEWEQLQKTILLIEIKNILIKEEDIKKTMEIIKKIFQQ